MSMTMIDISKDFERDDYAIGNIVKVFAPNFEGQYVIVGNGDSALLTLREITAKPGQGKVFKMGRKNIRVTHLSVPVEYVKTTKEKGDTV